MWCGVLYHYTILDSLVGVKWDFVIFYYFDQISTILRKFILEILDIGILKMNNSHDEYETIDEFQDLLIFLISSTIKYVFLNFSKLELFRFLGNLLCKSLRKTFK